MKKYPQIIMKVAVGLTILFGILLILFTNERTFKKIISDDIENISKLSASTIYAEINNSLTKPIFVGQTIANDLFLKNWLSQESASGGNQEQTDMMLRYLSDYSEKYGYESVFVVSEKSGIYYNQKGINKVISTEALHDVWYYDFIESGVMYKLNVDVDEANNNELTVFVDSRIEGSDGSLMGAAGVGIKMSHLQKLLQSYESEYDLKALLINDKGLVQVDSVDENIENENFFNNASMSELKQKILGEKDKTVISWYTKDQSEHCLITKYIENMDWFIAIEKNTSNTEQLLNAQMYRDLFIVGIIIALVLLMISYIISRYNRILLRTANKDDVTTLPNFKMFQEIFQKNMNRPACHEGIVFIFDIDHFKDINDRFGHLYGNTVLYQISQVAKAVIGNRGIIGRFGGDEFVGAIYGESNSVIEILNDLIKRMKDKQVPELLNITISVGVVYIDKSKKLDSMIQDADVAMYRSKDNGRNQITFI